METITRRQYLKLSAGTAALSLLSLKTLAQSPKKPNIIFIIADDMGWNDIGYQNPDIITPNINRLAESGVRFTHHYATPTCTPTRVAIMSGRYPSRFGVYSPAYGQIFSDDTVTLPKALQKAGYFTAISGKWHMGSPPEYTPLRYGFDSSYGYFHGQVDPYTHHYKNGEDSWHRNDKPLKEEGHATDLITNEAIRVIEEQKDNPFFLYVAYSVPHYPLSEPEKWTSLYNNMENESRRWNCASISHMDHGIGQIVEAVDRAGIRKNTVIIFLSDNGGQRSWRSNTEYGGDYADKPHEVLGDNEPLRGWKGQVYEGGIRVPGLINWHGTLQPGEMNTPIHVADWMPTLCTIANYQPQQDLNWDGQSMWNVISSDVSTPPQRVMYWNTGSMQAVRQGDMKLVVSDRGKTVELFNPAADPLEQKDLAPEQPEKVKELQAILNDLIRDDNSEK